MSRIAASGALGLKPLMKKMKTSRLTFGAGDFGATSGKSAG